MTKAMSNKDFVVASFRFVLRASDFLRHSCFVLPKSNCINLRKVLMTTSVIEIEVDVARNRNLYFVPIDRNVRGRFDWRRVADKHGPELRDQWGEEPLPGQTISLDLETGNGAIVEPLAAIPESRKRVEIRRESLAPARQEFENINPAAWLYWIKAAVEAGKARLLKGTLPETVDHKPARFGEQKSTTDRLLETLIALTTTMLSDKDRSDVAALLRK